MASIQIPADSWNLHGNPRIPSADYFLGRSDGNRFSVVGNPFGYGNLEFEYNSNIFKLKDHGNSESYNVTTREILDTSNITVIDALNRVLYSGSGQTALSWGARQLVDQYGQMSTDWENRQLRDYSGFQAVDWASRNLVDTSFNISVDWENKELEYFGQTYLTWAGGLGFFGHTPASLVSGYMVSNLSTQRTYDASTATIGDISMVLGTLIDDLKSYGLIS